MLELIRATFRDFRKDDVPRLAAALSYYTAFSLPPLLLLVMLMAGFLWDPQDVQGRLVSEIGIAMGPEAAEQIRSMIEQADRPGSGSVFVTIISIAALLFGATGAFAQVQAALNTAWNVKPEARGSGILRIFMKRVISFGMILVIVFLLIVSLVVSAILSAASTRVASMLPMGIGDAALWAIDAALSLGIITLLFMAIFKVLPDADVSWSDVWRGSLVTAVLFVLGKFLLGFYIGRSDPGSAFGAAGSLAVILVWIYYSAIIFFLGAEFTQVYAERRGSGLRISDASEAR